ncbi:hypothetical protein ACMBCM_07175, partial [Spiroplasma sp. K1]
MNIEIIEVDVKKTLRKYIYIYIYIYMIFLIFFILFDNFFILLLFCVIMLFWSRYWEIISIDVWNIK